MDLDGLSILLKCLFESCLSSFHHKLISGCFVVVFIVFPWIAIDDFSQGTIMCHPHNQCTYFKPIIHLLLAWRLPLLSTVMILIDVDLLSLLLHSYHEEASKRCGHMNCR